MYTRCTSCGTTYRITGNQLAAASGTVGCGRCGTRFNAMLNLSDAPPDTSRPPVADPGGPTAPPTPAPTEESVASASEQAFNEVFSLGEDPVPDAAPASETPPAPTPAAETRETVPAESLTLKAEPTPAADTLSLDEGGPAAEALALAEDAPAAEALALAENAPAAGTLALEEDAPVAEVPAVEEPGPVGEIPSVDEPGPAPEAPVLEHPAPGAGDSETSIQEAPAEGEALSASEPPTESGVPETAPSAHGTVDTDEEGHHYAAVASAPVQPAAASSGDGARAEAPAPPVEAYDDDHGIESAGPAEGTPPSDEDDEQVLEPDVGAALEATDADVKTASGAAYDDDHGIETDVADADLGAAGGAGEPPAVSAADWTPPGPGDEEPTVTDMRSMDIPGLLEIESDEEPAEPPEDDLEKTDLNLESGMAARAGDLDPGEEEAVDELEQSMEFDLPEDKWDQVFSDDLAETGASDQAAEEQPTTSAAPPEAPPAGPSTERVPAEGPAAERRPADRRPTDQPPLDLPLAEPPPAAPTPPAASTPPPPPDDSTTVTAVDDDQSIEVPILDESDFQGVEEIVLSSEGAKPEAPDFSETANKKSPEPEAAASEPEVPTFDQTEGDLLVPPDGKISDNFVGIGGALRDDGHAGGKSADGDLEKVLGKPRRRRLGLWVAAAILLLLGLAAQWVHYNRGALLRQPAISPWIERAYAAVGIDVQPDWDVDSLKLLGKRAVAAPDDEDTLNIVTEFRNEASFAQPHPRLRITLEDRWGQRLGTRDFAPSEYLESFVRGRELGPGESATAAVRIVDPGREASGFRIDLCLADAGGALSCSGQSP